MSAQRSMVSTSRDGQIVSDNPWGPGGSLTNFSAPTNYDGLTKVRVEVDGTEEEVILDDARGPMVMEPDGSRVFAMLNYPQAEHNGRYTTRVEKTWTYLTSTERTVFLHMVAKKNRRLRELKEEKLPRPAPAPHPGATRLSAFYKLLGRTNEPPV
ncbi:unnamed protein product [Effrenium voratum]|nr:unnamed protein product [Effrenium voratum]